MEKGSALYNELKTCAMKQLYKYYTPGCISLAGGLPLESCFPILEVNVLLPSSVGGGSSISTDEQVKELSGNKNIENEKSSFCIQRGLERGLFLNYTRGYGMAPLQEWINSHVNELHPRRLPDNENTELRNGVVPISTCMTVGATDAFAKVLMLIDTEVVLFDDFAYAGALTPCRSWGKTLVGVQSDEHGMIPSELRQAILHCRGQGLTVNLVYLVPTGGNPTGITIPLWRKVELLQVCREQDIFLVEDDAYYYISYHDLSTEDQTLSQSIVEKKVLDESSEPSMHSMPGLKNLPTSFLSLDVDGRVIRIDTLSKIIAPGMRLGWISAQVPFIEKFNILQECTTQSPSGLSQSIFLGLINHWGEHGFDDHIRQMQLHYCKQRDVLIKEIHANFAPNECFFVVPTCGMFIWLTFSVQNTSSFELFKAFAAVGVITVAASEFSVPAYGAEMVDDKPSVRLTYASASPEQLKTAVEKMAVCYRTIAAEKGHTTRTVN